MTNSEFKPQFLHDIPAQFEPLRSFLETNLKPYIKIIETGVTKRSDQSPQDPLTRWQSKIGGNPYFPKSATYPVDPTTGEAMALLVQINCADVPPITGFDFPGQGILQFYLGGFQLADAYLEPKRCQVLYFPDISKNEDDLITDFSFINLDETLRVDFPAIYELTFSVSRDLFWDSRYRREIQSPPELEELCQEFDDWIFEYYYDNYSDKLGSKLGGHPDLHANVNEMEESAKGNLLLELNQFDDGDDYLFFFIEEAHLKARNFSEVEYFHESD